MHRISPLAPGRQGRERRVRSVAEFFMSISEALSLALQHHRRGDLGAAEQLYWEILAADPNQVDALRLLGVIASQCGNLDFAIEYLGRAVHGNPNFADGHLDLGNAYLARGNFDNAIASYHRVLHLDPNRVDAINN